MEIKKYGTDYGSFWLPKNLKDYLSAKSVIYSFGAGEDISFDCLISGILDCPVYIFDPTSRAIQHVKQVKEVLETRIEPEYNKRIGGGDANYWKMVLESGCRSDNLFFFDYGVNIEDGKVKFYQPNNPEHVSCSISPLGRSSHAIEVEVKRLDTIMNKNGHKYLDLVKFDIENIECDIIDQMLDSEIYPKFLCVDFDYARTGQIGMNRTVELTKRLQRNGYRILKNDNMDVTFIKEDME